MRLFMTEEIRQNNNGFGKDNRGTSLVEIIVALLILVLIFTPAYMAFSAALKLNQASKDKLYAENIAKNAMEIIKYTMDTGGDYKAVDFAPLGFVSSSAVTSTGSAIYTLSECPEGTTKYDVTISILDEEGETLQTKFADMSAFNDTKTALINPSGITGGFDTNVVGYFEQLHTAYRNGLYQEDYERINELNNQLLEDWNYDCSIADMRGEARPPRPTLYEAPTPLRILSKEELADNFLRKELNVTIDKTPGGDYKLNSNVLYKLCSNNMDGTPGNFPTDSKAKVLDDEGPSRDLMEYPIDNYCKDVLYTEGLDNLYIMYTPLKAASDAAIILSNETINITNNVPSSDSKDLKVFLVIQAPDADKLQITNGLTVNVSSGAIGATSRAMKIFCNVDYTLNKLSGNSDKATTTQTLIDSDKKEELIYSVDISVKESGSSGNPINLKSSITKR